MFHHANGKPTMLTIFIVLWSVLQSTLAYFNFYQITDTLPPRFAIVLIPSTLLIVYGLLPKQSQWMFNNRNLRVSTFSHVVRLPVEIVLFYLFTHKLIPEVMTFEGSNYDIIMGITAPLIAWLFIKNKLRTSLLLMWNLPFQLISFDQPNRGMTYFPFILIPATIVPIVIWTHITDILKLRSL